MCFFLSSPDYIFMTSLSMERKNKAKGMRKWREQAKGEEKSHQKR